MRTESEVRETLAALHWYLERLERDAPHNPAILALAAGVAHRVTALRWAVGDAGGREDWRATDPEVARNLGRVVGLYREHLAAQRN